MLLGSLSKTNPVYTNVSYLQKPCLPLWHAKEAPQYKVKPYLQNINKTIKQLVITSNEGTSNIESWLYPVLLQKHRDAGASVGTPPSKEGSQPGSNERFPLNHRSPMRGPEAACRTSLYFIRYPLWSYSNQRMVPAPVSKMFLKLYRFSAKVLRFKKGLLSMEVTYSTLQ